MQQCGLAMLIRGVEEVEVKQVLLKKVYELRNQNDEQILNIYLEMLRIMPAVVLERAAMSQE